MVNAFSIGRAFRSSLIWKESLRIYGLKNYMAIVRSQLLYQGFIVSRWADEFDEARAQLAAWLAEGKLAHEETIMGECLPAAAS